MSQDNITVHISGNTSGQLAVGKNISQSRAFGNLSIYNKSDGIPILLERLYSISQSFPTEQRERVHSLLEDLTTDLETSEKPQLLRLKPCIAALLTVAISIGGAIATVTDFANNALELAEKFSIPAEAFQGELKQLKQIRPDFDFHIPE